MRSQANFAHIQSGTLLQGVSGDNGRKLKIPVATSTVQSSAKKLHLCVSLGQKEDNKEI